VSGEGLEHGLRTLEPKGWPPASAGGKAEERLTGKRFVGPPTKKIEAQFRPRLP